MKKIVVAVMGLAFIAAAAAAIAAATAEKCTVDAVEGDKVTMTCEKTTLKAGEQVTVNVEKKTETCEVASVDKDKVTMTCKKTELKAGEKVEVKAKAKEDKKVEGC